MPCSKFFFAAPMLLILSVGTLAQAADIAPDAAPAVSEGSNKLIFRLNALAGYGSQSEVNGLIKATNTKLAAGGFSIVKPETHPNSQADLYAGYEIAPGMDLGLAISAPPIFSKTLSGTDLAGNEATLRDSAGLFMAMVRGHYAFANTGAFQFYGSPSVGVGHFTLGSELTSSLSNVNLQSSAKGLIMRAAVGTAYEFIQGWSVTGEGGYLYAKSAALEVTTASVNTEQTVGSSLKGPTGEAVHSNLSGPFLGLGVSVRL